MSPSPAAFALTMRAHLRRNFASPDGYGDKRLAADWQTLNPAAPCFVSVSKKREVVDGGKNVVVEDIRGMFLPTEDIRVGDRIETLQDRRGRTVLEEILEVDAVTEKSAGPATQQREALLRRHRG